MNMALTLLLPDWSMLTVGSTGECWLRSNTHNLNILEFHENWDYDGFVLILTWSLISILWFSPKTASNFGKIKFQIFTLNVNILASNNKCHTLTLTFLQNIDILAHNNNCHTLSLTFLHSDRPWNILPCNPQPLGLEQSLKCLLVAYDHNIL